MEVYKLKLEVKNISKSFMNNGKENCVLKDISFDIEEEGFVTLLGPSGCGKTTTLTIMAGFVKQDSGVILLDGKEVTGPGPDKGFVFQNYALFPWKTVEGNIRFPMEQMKLSKPDQEDRLKYLLDISRLTEYKDYYPHQISGGMKQRNALVRALAVRPEVLFLDEPLGALDIEMRRSLQAELLDICRKEKITVAMVTHDVDEAIFLSDRIIVMTRDSGKILVNNKLDNIDKSSRNSDSYKESIKYYSQKFYEASNVGGKFEE